MKDFLSTTGEFTYTQQDYDEFKNLRAGKSGLANFRLNIPGPPTLRLYNSNFGYGNLDAAKVDIIDTTGVATSSGWLSGKRMRLIFFVPLSAGGPGQRSTAYGADGEVSFLIDIKFDDGDAAAAAAAAAGYNTIGIGAPGNHADYDGSIQDIIQKALVGTQHAGRIAWATSGFGAQADMQALGLQISEGSNGNKITITAPSGTGQEGTRIHVSANKDSSGGTLDAWPASMPGSKKSGDVTYLTGGRDLLKNPNKVFKISLGAFKSSCT